MLLEASGAGKANWLQDGVLNSDFLCALCEVLGLFLCGQVQNSSRNRRGLRGPRWGTASQL